MLIDILIVPIFYYKNAINIGTAAKNHLARDF